MSDRINKIFEENGFEADDEETSEKRTEKYRNAVAYQQEQKEKVKNDEILKLRKENSAANLIIIGKIMWLLIIVVCTVFGALLNGFWGAIGGLLLSIALPMVFIFVITR